MQNKDDKNWRFPPELFGISGLPLLPLEVGWDVLHSEINCCQYFMLNLLVPAAKRAGTGSMEALVHLLREVDLHTASIVSKFARNGKEKGQARPRFIGRQARKVLEIFPYITNTLLQQDRVTAATAMDLRV